MGYTHTYYVKKSYDGGKFARVVTDFKELLKPLEHLGVKLGDAFGEGDPVITNDEIRFNGIAECGHLKRDLGIAWPARGAKGLQSTSAKCMFDELHEKLDTWGFGAKLTRRTCGGDCSHETFVLERVSTIPRNHSLDRFHPLRFAFCKTAYKPYDLAVIACLIIAKHHFGYEIKILSNGQSKDWDDARMLCQHFLGYGEDFELDSGGEEESESESSSEWFETMPDKVVGA